MFNSLRTLLAAAVLAPAAALAQSGRIVGTVTDAGSRTGVESAQITVVGTARGAFTDAQGHYTVYDVPSGTYEVRVQRIGQQMKSSSGVVVRAGQETRVDFTLDRAPLELAGVVVSASRRVEKVTEAPATITRIGAQQIENTVGNSFSGALKGVTGVDFVQVGVTAAAINTRGFNSSFNNRVLMMEDGRIAVLPENGLPVGSFTTIPKVDLAAVEVLVGPGSALYGPDASNGVVTLESKDPKQYPGTTIEIAGGSRSYMDVQARQAGVLAAGQWGYKLTGEYQSAKDWENHNVYAPVAGTQAPEIGADFNTNVVRGAGALDYYMGDARLELSGGMSKSNGIGQTNVGRNQLVDWQYRHAQLKYTAPHWFAQLYKTQSLSGDTYQLNGFAQNRVRFPALSVDSVKHLSDFPAEGNLNAAELQNNFVMPMSGTRLTWGGQFRRDVVSSKRQWLVDRQTGQDIKVNQRGVYAQLEQDIGPMFRVIGAGRYDKHDYYDAQWSPKAGLLFTPIPDQTFRVTFNRAFKSPTILQTGFYFPDFSPGIGLLGNRYGFDVRDTLSGALVRHFDPIVPETNDTYEVGYKGVLGNRLFLDVTGYRMFFENFMTPLVILNLAPAGTGVYQNGVRFNGASGRPQLTLSYINVGKARLDGTDVGARFLVSPNITVNGTTSFQKLKDVQRTPGFQGTATNFQEATSFNSPNFKWSLGTEFAELMRAGLTASVNARHVQGYNFRSGVNYGYNPAFSTVDLSLGYALPFEGTRLNVNVQNLFTCRAGESTPNGFISGTNRSIYKPDSKCGFGEKHTEMLNMPALGTMVFVGLRWDR
ncbi:MAG TPA: TonB-dependent receptor [Gemmatimonadaceae bacterium]|nr:TonB-dependent receptor [Gemmatimonadaceae bacterium]